VLRGGTSEDIDAEKPPVSGGFSYGVSGSGEVTYKNKYAPYAKNAAVAASVSMTRNPLQIPLMLGLNGVSLFFAKFSPFGAICQ